MNRGSGYSSSASSFTGGSGLSYRRDPRYSSNDRVGGSSEYRPVTSSSTSTTRVPASSSYGTAAGTGSNVRRSTSYSSGLTQYEPPSRISASSTYRPSATATATTIGYRRSQTPLRESSTPYTIGSSSTRPTLAYPSTTAGSGGGGSKSDQTFGSQSVEATFQRLYQKYAGDISSGGEKEKAKSSEEIRKREEVVVEQGEQSSKDRSKSPAPAPAPATPRMATTMNREERSRRTMENLLGDLYTSSTQPQQQKAPLLLVTQPSLPETAMAPITPITATNVIWRIARGVEEEDQEAEDEEYSSEYCSDEYTDEDEEEFDSSDVDYDASVCKTLQLGTGARGDLYPTDPTTTTGGLSPLGLSRSVTPDYDSEFELPFVEDPRRNSSRGRLSPSNALPPPIFTASFTYDGMDSWDSHDDSIDSLSSIMVSSNEDGDQYCEAVDVGCTLTLVEKAAMRGSDGEEEYTSSGEYTSSDQYDEDEETSSFYGEDESEGEYSASEEGEVSASMSMPLKEHVVGLEEEVGEEGEEQEEMAEAVHLEVEEPLVVDALSPSAVESGDGEKSIQRVETYVKPQEEFFPEENTSSLAAGQKPKTDFAKKGVIQPMRSEKVQVSSGACFVMDAKPVEEKPKVESAPPSKEPTPPVTQVVMRTRTAAQQMEDKSAQRKSILNMAEEERKRADALREEKARQKARRSGAVSAMMERFKEPTVIKEEPITYKRSSRLEPKVEESRPKKTYNIVKPANDDFDKQMAELREQMKSKTSQLRSEYKDLSQGIHGAADEAKLKAMDSKHKELLGATSTVFGVAEDEKKRWKEGRESEAERKRREAEEREHLKKVEPVKPQPAPAVTVAEPKRTVRRAKKADLEEGKDKVNTPAVGDSKLSTPVRKYSNRRKTEELINFTQPPPYPPSPSSTDATTGTAEKEAVKPPPRGRKRRHPNRKKRPFTRKPFDIDDLLGLSQHSKSFDQMDGYFTRTNVVVSGEKKSSPVPGKRRRFDHQKVWISELKDIDKLYTSSQLRDIKFSADAA